MKVRQMFKKSQADLFEAARRAAEAPEQGERQSGSTEHICEVCGRFGYLYCDYAVWKCEECLVKNQLRTSAA